MPSTSSLQANIEQLETQSTWYGLPDGWAGLALGLALLLFYFGSPQLPLTFLGALIFCGLALLRPDLALLAVPMTAPLFLTPKVIMDERFGLARPQGYFVPLHEFVLLCVLIGTTLVLLRGWQNKLGPVSLRSRLRAAATSRSILWPLALFVLAGTLGVLVAAEQQRALREWRWLIIEPVLFYGLVRYWARNESVRWRLVWAFLFTGIALAIFGLLQVVGGSVVAQLPFECLNTPQALLDGGLRRASSVYCHANPKMGVCECHPNNLGMILGRIWPVFAALAFALPSMWQERVPRVVQHRWLLSAGALVCLLALGASFSKGAFLGAVVALAILALLLRRRLLFGLLGLATTGLVGMLLLGLFAGVERFNPLGASTETRADLWRSALQMIRDQPLTGIGLDQFFYYRSASEYGDRYITSEARATGERFTSHPHTIVLDLLLRMGPLGLLAMSWLVIYFWKTSYRRLHELQGANRALIAGLMVAMGAALAHSLIDSFYFVTDLAFAFWLMLGLVERPAEPIAAHSIQHEATHDYARKQPEQGQRHASADRA